MNKVEKKNEFKFILLSQITYIKFYIDALLTNRNDTVVILDMLLSIQDKITFFLKEFIGIDASKKLTHFMKQRIVLISKFIEQKKSHNEQNEIMNDLMYCNVQIAKIINIPPDELNHQNQFIFAMIYAQLQNEIMKQYTIFNDYCEYILLFSDTLLSILMDRQTNNSSLINSFFIKFPTYVFSAWGFMDHK